MGKIWARIFNMLKRNYCYEVCLCLCLCLCICLCFCLCICVPIEREYDDHWWRASVPWWPCPALHWWRPYKACKATIQPRNTNHEQLKKPKETWYSNTFCSHLKSITNPAREQAVKAPMILHRHYWRQTQKMILFNYVFRGVLRHLFYQMTNHALQMS